MQPVKSKWQASGLVLVCERCSKERIPNEDPAKAAEIGDFNLRDWLKAKLKDAGQWGHIRAINTGCMDVCPKGRITVAIDPQQGDGHAQVFTVDPVCDKEELLEKILQHLAD